MAKAKKGKLTIEDALVPVEEHPYEIPENWCWTTLEALYSINPKNQADDTITASFIPMEKIEGGFTSNFTYEIQEWGKAKKAHTQFADGDVAFAKISPCFENRKSMIVTGLENGIGAGTTELIILRQSQMNQKYTYYFISNEEFINGGKSTYSGTVGQQRISMDYVRKYPVPVPPLAEQKRIVEQIENLFSKLDEAKEKAQIVVDSFEIRRASVLHDAFTGKLSVKWRNEKNREISSREVSLGDITDIKSSKRVYKEDYVDSGVPFFRSTEVVELYDYGTTTPNMFITREKYEEIKKEKGVPRQGNLLVTSVGTIGKTWIVDDREFYYKDGNLTEVEQCDELDMRFLQYFIMSEEFNNQVIDTVSGSAYNALTIVKFKKIKIMLPEIDEQQFVVDTLEKVLSKEAQAKEAAEQVIEQIDLMKKSILAKAFRGELGTNIPEEGSSIELLKQIIES